MTSESRSRCRLSRKAIIASWIASTVLLSEPVLNRVEAQRVDASRAGLTNSWQSAANKELRPYYSGPRTDINARVVHHALVGAAIGAAAGLGAAFWATHQDKVEDHSEDGLAYRYYTATGAVIGLVAGVIVAIVW